MHLAHAETPAWNERPRRAAPHVIHIEPPQPQAASDGARQLVELSPEAILVYRGDAITLVNQAACRLLGVDNAEPVLGRSVFDFVHPDCHAMLRRPARASAPATASSPFMEQVWIRLDGSLFHAEVATTSLIYDDAPAVQIALHDISERKRMEQLALGENRILNLVATGAPLAEILDGIAQFIQAQSSSQLHAIQMRGADGEWLSGADEVPSSSMSLPIHGKEGAPLGTLRVHLGRLHSPARTDMGLLHTCTRLAGIALESRASEERMRFLAHYDELTRLPNRFLFKEYLDQALSQAQRQGRRFAVYFIDFDRFKEINDCFGHEAGDRVLRQISANLRGALRDADKIARIGGDEFTLLVEELRDEQAAARVAEKLLAAASRPIRLPNEECHEECKLSASIGIAVYPRDGTDAATLLRNADQAMYEAKQAGKDGYRFYTAGATTQEPA